MLNDNFLLGQYRPGQTIVHRLDPRVKLLVVLAFGVVLFAVHTYPGLGVIAALWLLTAWGARLSLKSLLRGLRPVLVLVVVTFLLHAFFTPGEALMVAGPLHVTREGLAQGGLISLRLLLILIGASLLTLTTSPLKLADGLESLLRPARRLGVPTQDLAMMTSIALRFVPTLLEETEKIFKAQAMRGLDLTRGSLRQRGEALASLLVPLLVSVLRRADELAVAMEARCYRVGQERSHLHELRWERRDGIAGFVAAGLACLALLFNWR